MGGDTKVNQSPSPKPLDVAAIKRKHRSRSDGDGCVVYNCGSWPCDPYRLAEEVERLRVRLYA
jgi:hypothetical protein